MYPNTDLSTALRLAGYKQDDQLRRAAAQRTAREVRRRHTQPATHQTAANSWPRWRMLTILRTVTSRAALAFGAVAIIGLTTTGSASAVVTASKTGSYGSLLSSGKGLCWGEGWDNSSITAPGTTVSRAPTYPGSVQTIWAIHRLEYWTGTKWSIYRYGTWRRVVTSSGQAAMLLGETLPISGIDMRNGYRTYRVATTYQWQVGQTTIGTVTNYYESKDYSWGWTSGYTVIPSVASTSPGYSSWCTWPGVIVNVVT